MAALCTLLICDTLTPNIPTRDCPVRFYSNQCQQDLRATLLHAIDHAQGSIHLVMFGLSDRAILSAVARKIKEQIPTKIFYDATGSPNVARILEGGEIQPLKITGLMHQKILVIDEELVFIGSANMTSASLRMHDNLVIGLVSPSLARFLKEHVPPASGYFRTTIGRQEFELWLLPDPRGHALADLRKKIRSATRSIKIALFTLTHPALIDEVIAAHRRGVSVSVVVDMHSGLGASANAVEKLQKGGVRVLLSQGTQLLHHKFIYIDEQTLLTGSANWTKSAFYKNSDCFLGIHQLTMDQKEFMNRLWTRIETNAK